MQGRRSSAAPLQLPPRCCLPRPTARRALACYSVSDAPPRSPTLSPYSVSPLLFLVFNVVLFPLPPPLFASPTPLFSPIGPLCSHGRAVLLCVSHMLPSSSLPPAFLQPSSYLPAPAYLSAVPPAFLLSRPASPPAPLPLCGPRASSHHRRLICLRHRSIQRGPSSSPQSRAR